jgi:hypothetical protein
MYSNRGGGIIVYYVEKKADLDENSCCWFEQMKSPACKDFRAQGMVLGEGLHGYLN